MLGVTRHGHFSALLRGEVFIKVLQRRQPSPASCEIQVTSADTLFCKCYVSDAASRD